MLIEDILKSLPDPDSYYAKTLRRLQKLAADNHLDFSSEAKHEWHLDITVEPGRRVFYSLSKPGFTVGGFVIVPEPDRKHDYVAWNRFYDPVLSDLRKLEAAGLVRSSLHCISYKSLARGLS